MLTYDNTRTYSMIFLCRVGSVVPAAALWGLCSAALTLIIAFGSNPLMRGVSPDQAALQTVREYVRDDLFSQPYSHYIISYMLGFLLIFRVQLSYARYWDGLTHLYESINRLICAAAMVIAFDELAEGDAAIRGYQWRKHMMHLFSLLAGTQLLEIRFNDLELAELSPLHKALVMRPPPGEARMTRAERVLRKLVSDAPKNEAFDANAAGLSAHLAKVMDNYPVEIIDGVADDEKAHLEMHAPMYDQAVNARIVRMMSKRLNDGGLSMPPPIVSRIYQEIALGNSAFKQALKISRIPFPFPYAQLLEVVKFFVIVVTPLVVLAKQDLASSTAQVWINTLWSTMHAFVVAFNFVAMTKVAQEMEDPFGVDYNDLPLLSMHDELNFRLERLLHEQPPAVDFAYNPNSKFTQAARSAMFAAMGDKQCAPTSSQGLASGGADGNASDAACGAAASRTCPPPLALGGAKGVSFARAGSGATVNSPSTSSSRPASGGLSITLEDEASPTSGSATAASGHLPRRPSSTSCSSPRWAKAVFAKAGSSIKSAQLQV